MLTVYQPWCPQRSRGPEPGLTCCRLGRLPPSRPRACSSITVVGVPVTRPGAAPAFSWQLLKRSCGHGRWGLGARARVPLLPGWRPELAGHGGGSTCRVRGPCGPLCCRGTPCRAVGSQGLTCVGAHPGKAAPGGRLSAHRPGREPQFIPCPGPSVCTSSVCTWKPSAPGGGGRWALGRRLRLAEITRVGPRDGVSALLAEEEAPELTECPVRRASVCRPEGRSSPGVESASPRP